MEIGKDQQQALADVHGMLFRAIVQVCLSGKDETLFERDANQMIVKIGVPKWGIPLKSVRRMHLPDVSRQGTCMYRGVSRCVTSVPTGRIETNGHTQGMFRQLHDG